MRTRCPTSLTGTHRLCAGAGEPEGELELAEGLGAARAEDEERLARGIRHDRDRRRHELFAGLHGGEVIVEGGFGRGDPDDGIGLDGERHGRPTTAGCRRSRSRR